MSASWRSRVAEWQDGRSKVPNASYDQAGLAARNLGRRLIAESRWPVQFHVELPDPHSRVTGPDERGTGEALGQYCHIEPGDARALFHSFVVVEDCNHSFLRRAFRAAIINP